MDKSTAWLEIIIIIIISFLIGFIIAWLYWRWKRKIDGGEDHSQEISETKQKDDCCEELGKLQSEFSSLKERFDENNHKIKDYIILFDLITANIDEGMTISDKDGDFLVFNKQMEIITGYSKEDANTAPLFLECIYPDPEYRHKVVEDIEQLDKEVDDHHVQTTITCKSGDQVDLSVSSQVIEITGRNYYQSVFRKK